MRPIMHAAHASGKQTELVGVVVEGEPLLAARDDIAKEGGGVQRNRSTGSLHPSAHHQRNISHASSHSSGGGGSELHV